MNDDNNAMSHAVSALTEGKSRHEKMSTLSMAVKKKDVGNNGILVFYRIIIINNKEFEWSNVCKERRAHSNPKYMSI